MRLNLGCGSDVRDDYVNVDFRKTHASVVKVDLSQFPWPFEDSSAEEILMLDFLEHFPYRTTQQILLECYRVLKPEGQLVIQVPDAEHTMRAFVQEGEYLCNACGTSMQADVDGLGELSNLEECPKCKQSSDDISEAAMRRFYGGQDFEGNFHFTAFTSRSLQKKAWEAGFVTIPQYCSGAFQRDHFYANWTLYMVFKKGELW